MSKEPLFTPCQSCGGVAVNFFRGEVSCASCGKARSDIGIINYTSPVYEKSLIRDIQREHDSWARTNFPAQYEHPHQPVLGVCEEAGELAHAVLKAEQNIRGTKEELLEQAKDALGDIFVYMMSYANVMGWDLQEIILDTWDQVKKRDWLKYPLNGVSE